MATLINQVTVLTILHNLMGHRVAPGGTDEDLKRYVQHAFDYAWRYHKWGFSLKTASIASDGILPEDFDYEGYREFNGITEVDAAATIATGNTGSAVTWNSGTNRFVLSPAAAGTVVYQYTPPTLGTDTAGSAPFPSAHVIALGATVYAKMADNPSRANVKQEWDMFHNELDRLVARSYNAQRTRPQSYHDANGTYVGNVG